MLMVQFRLVVVLVAGLEPARYFYRGIFKSLASAYSTTAAR